MDLRQIATLYRHEIRCALRERSIVAFSIVIPLVMYPLLLWAMFAGFTFVEGQADRLTSRVVIQELPESHQTLRDSIEAHGRITLVSLDWGNGPSEDTAGRELVERRIDALVRFQAAEADGSALPDNFRIVLTYDEARGRSVSARERVTEAVASYRRGWIDDSRRDLGVSDPVWADYALVRSDVATADETSRFLLGLLVPFLTLITVALAAFYPAIDATAGERERSTWETLMTVAAPRANVAAAKYLYVATFGAMGGLLNLIALALTLRWILPAGGPVGGDGAAPAIPLASLPAIGVGIALLGLFVAAGMLAFAVFARNFKEGQSMITPFYLLMLAPVFLIQSPDIEFTPAIAAIPIANVAMLVRAAITGSVPLVPGAITLAVMGACVAGSVAFVQWVMRREEVLLGTGEGGLLTFLKRRLANGG